MRLRHWNGRGAVLILALASLWLMVSCARYMPSELHQICLRTERLGYLHGRNTMWNTHGVQYALKNYPLSVRGMCVAGQQGETVFYQVCLVASTECGNDRHTRVHEDQWERYMEKYPGSFMCMDQTEDSTCQECIQEPDDCFTSLGLPEDNSCLQYDRECKDYIDPEIIVVEEQPMGGRRK